MTKEHQRVVTARPRSINTRNFINPLHEDSGEAGAEKDAVREGQCEAWEETVKKIEELETKVTEHFEQQGQENQRSPPVIKAPAKPTQEQWERHQVTHTHTICTLVPPLSCGKKCEAQPSIERKRRTNSAGHRVRGRCYQSLDGIYVFA